MTRLGLAVMAYLVPTFALGFVWHLVLFERYYQSLQIYRSDIIIPFGFLSMLIQGGIFGWIYARAFASSPASPANRAISYGLLGAALSWSFIHACRRGQEHHGLRAGLSVDRNGLYARPVDDGCAADGPGVQPIVEGAHDCSGLRLKAHGDPVYGGPRPHLPRAG